MASKTKRHVGFVVLFLAASALYYLPIVAVLQGTDWSHPTVYVGSTRIAPQTQLPSDCSPEFTDPSAITVRWDTWKPLKRVARVLELSGVPGFWTWALCAFGLLTLTVCWRAAQEEHPDTALKATLKALAFAGLLTLLVYIIFISVTEMKTESVTKGFVDPSVRQAVSVAFTSLDSRWSLSAGLGGYTLLLVASFIAGIILAALYMDLIRNGLGNMLIRRAATRYGKQERYSLIMRDDEIELRASNLKVVWLPWPHVVWSEESRESVLPVAQFWDHARQQGMRVRPEEVAESITREVQIDLVSIHNQVDAQFRSTALKCVHLELDRRVRALQNGMPDEQRKDAQALVQDVSDRTLSKFREDLVAGALETASDELVPFKNIVAESLRGRVIDTLRSSGDISTLLPVGARFFAAHGTTSMVVIEQQPQVRTLYWRKGSLEKYLHDLAGWGVTVTDEMRQRVKERPLFEVALPYLVFLFRFVEGIFRDVWIYCRTSPLERFADELYLPPLPHVRQGDGLLCLGDINIQPGPGSIAEVTDALMAYFWQSRFDYRHWAGYFRNGEEMHPDLRTLWSWEEASRRDPRFILEAKFPVPIAEHAKSPSALWQETIKDTLAAELLTYDALMARALEDGEAALRKIVTDFVRAVSVERRYPRTIEEELNRALKGATDAILASIKERVDALPDEADSEAVRRAWNEAVIQAVSAALARRVSARGTVMPDLTTKELVAIMRSHGKPERRN